MALGVDANSEVIVPSLTFSATVNAVKYVDAKPVFCDIISHDKPTIDPRHIERLISNKTKAIIIMHYAGFACEIDDIISIAKRHNLKIIEDACHAPFSEYNGQKLGTFGDIGCFSFFSNKNISTGEGGIITTNNKALYEKINFLDRMG